MGQNNTSSKSANDFDYIGIFAGNNYLVSLILVVEDTTLKDGWEIKPSVLVECELFNLCSTK